MAIDFGALPPEVNSARMYAGPGAGSLAAAAAMWDELAADLHAAASSYRSVITGLTAERWMGPSSLAMASAFGPYVAWTVGAAARAAEAASQAKLAVESYESAFAMTVPPHEVVANRVQLASLVATNFLGQNTAAIAATEAQYAEMWAQDAAAMYAYATGSAEASVLTQFTSPPEVVDGSGLAAQTAKSAATSTSAGAQSTLSQLMSTISATLNGLASPIASTASSSTSSTITGLLGGVDMGSVETSIVASYALLPGWFAMFIGGDAIAPLMGTPMSMGFTALQAAAAAPAAAAAAADAVAPAAAAAADAAAVPVTLTSAIGGQAGALVGQAAAVGGLSVPATWGWAAAAPAMLGGGPFAMSGPGLGAPLIFGGLPRAAAAGTGGTTAARYGARPSMVARSPAAGYPKDPVSVPTGPYPVPAGLPPPAPGYTPAIVYLPTNGQAPTGV